MQVRKCFLMILCQSFLKKTLTKRNTLFIGNQATLPQTTTNKPTPKTQQQQQQQQQQTNKTNKMTAHLMCLCKQPKMKIQNTNGKVCRYVFIIEIKMCGMIFYDLLAAPAPTQIENLGTYYFWFGWGTLPVTNTHSMLSWRSKKDTYPDIFLFSLAYY